MVVSPVEIQNTVSQSMDWDVDFFAGNNSLVLPKSPLFGTDGIRGRVGELLDTALALQVGFWAGLVLQDAHKSGVVIIGQDSRNSSDFLATSVAAGLTASGLEVWNLGLCPTPGVAYLTSISNAVGGVMISASHNPPEDNGIKFFGSNGAKLAEALQNQVEAGVRGQTLLPINKPNKGQHYHRPELIRDYLESIKKTFSSSLQGMRIVLDLAWGAAVGIAPAVFKEMGAEVICLHNQADGDLINVNCGSTHLAPLQEAVLKHNADLGLAFDGDADRVLAVDDRANPINGDYILYLWGKSLQATQQLPNNTIVSTVMANLGFERAWEKQGGKLFRTNVGDRYVQAQMQTTGAMLGGEQSGHILCPHYGVTGDGIATGLHLAALVKRSGTSLSQLATSSFTTYPQLLKNVRVENRDRRMNWAACDRLQSAIFEAETAMGNQGRILVRASGTEPVIRVMVEAADADLTQHWAEQLAIAVQKYIV
ncbi:MAG: phosphoglucosamine mutase [Chroococcus sp. CMT-3BRIN-NPC107]|jgi:phosphoglucosamine mutase|nr:phosphoglucosamine mutase [Chroococcus sp. CMT-3BRIN-NPC107]